jgi:hypothetical protein
MGLEGVVSKRRDAPYRSGRSKTWLKVALGARPFRENLHLADIGQLLRVSFAYAVRHLSEMRPVRQRNSPGRPIIDLSHRPTSISAFAL